MFGKIVFWVMFFVAISFLGLQLYENIPRSPIELVLEKKVDPSTIILDYGDTPVFQENLRFNHNDISYHISNSCSSKKANRMKRALNIFEDEFNIITFASTPQRELADIKVICSNQEVSIGDNLFTVGEGGPSKIINTSQFKIIEEGKISLYKETSECDYPVVELHELLHVFGFDHTPNPKSIMYNISECDQRITPDMVTILTELYEIEPLPDITIKGLEANKRGRYLDFNITLLNEGLLDSPAFTLSLMYRGEEFESFAIEEIEIGHGRTIRATNVRLPSLRVESLNFVADNADVVREFNEQNNLMQMRVKK